MAAAPIAKIIVLRVNLFKEIRTKICLVVAVATLLANVARGDYDLPLTAEYRLAIFFDDLDTCSGTILDDWHVITAADCPFDFGGRRRAGTMRVYPLHQINETSVLEANGGITVEMIYVTKDQDVPCESYFPMADLAILKLSHKLGLDYTTTIKKVNLPKWIPEHAIDNAHDNLTGFTIGYQVPSIIHLYGKSNAKSLQLTAVKVLPQKQCDNPWRKFENFKVIVMCGQIQSVKVKGYCETAIGNGLIHEGTLIGVAFSTDSFCFDDKFNYTTKPILYTRVASFLPFINLVTNQTVTSDDTCSFPQIAASSARISTRFDCAPLIVVYMYISYLLYTDISLVKRASRTYGC